MGSVEEAVMQRLLAAVTQQQQQASLLLLRLFKISMQLFFKICSRIVKNHLAGQLGGAGGDKVLPIRDSLECPGLSHSLYITLHNAEALCNCLCCVPHGPSSPPLQIYRSLQKQI